MLPRYTVGKFAHTKSVLKPTQRESYRPLWQVHFSSLIRMTVSFQGFEAYSHFNQYLIMRTPVLRIFILELQVFADGHRAEQHGN